MLTSAYPMTPLDRLDLDLKSEAVFDALKPFIAAEKEQDRYESEIKWRWRRLRKRLYKRYKARWRGRHKDAIKEEYNEVWAAGHSRYDVTRGPQSSTPWTWRDKKILVDAAGSARYRSLMLGAVIDKLRPKRVLEVGCGDGINLLLLAGAYPDIEFTGLELTTTGNQTAIKAQEADTLPLHLRNYAPLPQSDLKAFKRIKFVQGDATAMPFADGEFDLVYSVLALEQMEQVRRQALREVARVTRDAVLNLEPFRDANRCLKRRLYVMSQDYFRGSIAGMKDYGLTPQWATDDYPQEVFLGSAFVLSRKASAEKR